MEKLFWDMVEEYPSSEDEEVLLEPPKGAVDIPYNQKRFEFHTRKHQIQLQQQVKRHAFEIVNFLRDNQDMIDPGYVFRQVSILDPMRESRFEHSVLSMLDDDNGNRIVVSGRVSPKIRNRHHSYDWDDMEKVAKHMIDTDEPIFLSLEDIEDSVKSQFASLRREQRAEKEQLREHQHSESIRLQRIIRKQPICPVPPQQQPIYNNSNDSYATSSLSISSVTTSAVVNGPPATDSLNPQQLATLALYNQLPLNALSPEQMNMINQLIRTMAANNIQQRLQLQSLQQQPQNATTSSRDPRVIARGGAEGNNNNYIDEGSDGGWPIGKN